MDSEKIERRMVQYGLWPNCCNNCDFCLRMNRTSYSKSEQIKWIKKIRNNIDYIDWKNKFSSGISLLGGELYYITDKDVQDNFMLLIDDIVEKILKRSSNPYCKYSSVTNGLYDPSFLYRVVDRIARDVPLSMLDINFSFDLKYRYKSKADMELALRNINQFHERYNYKVGVLMILTLYLIDMWRRGEFDVNTFIDLNIPGNVICFLYPHPVHSGKTLDDFNFRRADFLEFIMDLKEKNSEIYRSFIESTKNSGIFKYTGYIDRIDTGKKIKKIVNFFLKILGKTKYDVDTQQPRLADGKEIINEKCGHSTLYRCYSDCDNCMLCDLRNLEGDLF